MRNEPTSEGTGHTPTPFRLADDALGILSDRVAALERRLDEKDVEIEVLESRVKPFEQARDARQAITEYEEYRSRIGRG